MAGELFVLLTRNQFFPYVLKPIHHMICSMLKKILLKYYPIILVMNICETNYRCNVWCIIESVHIFVCEHHCRNYYNGQILWICLFFNVFLCHRNQEN